MFRNTITLCYEILNYQRESQVFFTSENTAIFHQLPSKHKNSFKNLITRKYVDYSLERRAGFGLRQKTFNFTTVYSVQFI